MSQYSPLFEVIYDEQNPIGFLGRDTHYSVLQCPARVNGTGDVQAPPRQLRFVVIWDEDHDKRIILVLEGFYLEGLLTPIMFVGERKGMLTVILEPSIDPSFEKKVQDAFASNVTVMDDTWTVKIQSFDESSGIINDYADKVQTYLKNIRNIWRLGAHEFE